jgi:hypothetical protein
MKRVFERELSEFFTKAHDKIFLRPFQFKKDVNAAIGYHPVYNCICKGAAGI